MASNQNQQAISSDYTKPFDKSDVSFIFDDQSRLYFNQAFLSFLSPVFDALFSGDWSETSIPSKEIPLPGTVMSDFHTLFRFLRKSDIRDSLSEENVQILLKLAGEYQIESVLADCSAYILANWKNDPEKHLEAVSLASQYGLKSLIEAFVPLAAMRSLEEISALAPTMASNVYDAILHRRRIQQQELQQTPVSENLLSWSGSGQKRTQNRVVKRPDEPQSARDTAQSPHGRPASRSSARLSSARLASPSREQASASGNATTRGLSPTSFRAQHFIDQGNGRWICRYCGKKFTADMIGKKGTHHILGSHNKR